MKQLSGLALLVSLLLLAPAASFPGGPGPRSPTPEPAGVD